MDQNTNISKKLYGAVAWAYLDKISVQALSMIVSIILARILSTQDYGIVSIALIFIMLLDVLIEPGFNSAIVRKKSPDGLDYSTMFVFNAVVGVVLYIILYFAAPLIANFWEKENLVLVIRVLAIKIPMESVVSIQKVYVQKNLLYKKYMIVSLISTVLTAVIAVTMVFTGLGIWALIANTVIKTLADMLFAFIFIPWKPSFKFSFPRFKSLFAFGKNLLLAKLINTAYTELSGILIGKKYSSEDLAYYDRGKRFPDMIISSINTAVGNVLFTVLSDIQDEAERVKKVMRKTISTCGYIFFPLLVGLCACSESFVQLFLTDKWLPCVPYLRLLCFYNLFIPVSNGIYQAVKAHGKSDVIFRIETAKKILGIAVLVMAVVFFGEPIYIAIGLLLTIVLSTVIDLYIASKYVNYRLSEFFKDLSLITVANTVMGIVVYFIGKLPLNCALTLLIQVIAGISVYMLLSAVFKIEEFRFVINMLKKKNDKSSESF